jgi:hypothetical protein
MRQNHTKFGLEQKIVFKKSFEFYCQISVRIITKVAKIMSILHGINESEQNTANIW